MTLRLSISNYWPYYSEFDSNEKDLSDAEYEDEELVDHNGDSSGNAREELSNKLQEIAQRHRERLERTLEKYIMLSEIAEK